MRLNDKISRTEKNRNVSKGSKFSKPVNKYKNHLRISKIVFCMIVMLILQSETKANKEHIFKNNFTFDLTKTKWYLTNGKYFLSKEKTPDNEAALLIKVDGKNCIVNGGKFNQNKIRNINSDWNELSFWIKSDDSNAVLKVTFISDTPNDKKKLAYHVATVKLLGKKWKKISLKSTWASNNKKFQLKNFKYLTFHIIPYGKKAELLIGPVSFKLKNDQKKLLPLKVKDAYKTQNPPLIDGKLNDSCWENSAIIKDFILNKTGVKPFPAEVKICYDANNLYVSAKQWRDTAKMRSTQTTAQMNVWKDSCFEFFLSPKNNIRTSYQYIVNKLNVKQGVCNFFDQVKDDFRYIERRYGAKWQSATQIEKNYWTIEMKIPFSDTIPNIKPDSILGMQVVLEGTGVWNNTNRNTNPANFGVLNLITRPSTDAIKLKSANLFLDPKIKIPELELKLDSSAKIMAQIFITNLNPFVAKQETEIVKNKLIKITDYRPVSGLHRLTIALNKNSERSVFAFKTNNITFAQVIPYGTDVLCPFPKLLTKGKDQWFPNKKMKIFATPRALKIAGRVKKELHGYLQIDLPVKKTFLPQKWAICITANPDIIKPAIQTLNTRQMPKAQGYYLQINKHNVIIVGKDAAGLFYGIVTLSQLERYAFLRNENFLVEYNIKDWPDLRIRGWENWTQALLLRNMKSSHSELMNTFIDHLDRIAIGSKLNRFTWNFADLFQYEDSYNQPLRMWEKGNFVSLQNLREINKHCRDNYTEFVPAANSAGHSLWMTLPHPELVMPGYSNWDANPLHPNYYKVIFSAYNEIINAVKPKTFNIFHDEWWHQPRGKVTTKFNGIEKREIFFKEIMTLYSYFKKKNVRISMFTDMLQRGHNGGLPYNNYLNLEKLPRDIIMCPWSGGDAVIEKLSSMGFDVLPGANRFQLYNTKKLRNLKHLIGLKFLNYHYMKPDMEYGFTALIRGADYAWNIFSGDNVSLNDWLLAKAENLMALYSVLPNPNAGRTFQCLNIEKYCNDSYVKSNKTKLAIDSLNGGKMQIGFIPMLLSGKSTPKNCIVGSNTTVTIPVGKNASSIIVLHTQITPKDKRNDLYLKARYYCDGIHTAKYLVNYNDGTRAPFYMRNAVNCGNWIPYKGRVTTAIECKYLVDCRYTWSGKPQKNGIPCLYQYEWVNPYPQKVIKNIEFISMNTEATPILFGITLRDNL